MCPLFDATSTWPWPSTAPWSKVIPGTTRSETLVPAAEEQEAARIRVVGGAVRRQVDADDRERRVARRGAEVDPPEVPVAGRAARRVVGVAGGVEDDRVDAAGRADERDVRPGGER